MGGSFCCEGLLKAFILWEYSEEDTERTTLETGTHYLRLDPAKNWRSFPGDLNKSHTEYANMILFFFIVPILVISRTPQIADENIQFCIKVAEPTYELVVAMETEYKHISHDQFYWHLPGIFPQKMKLTSSEKKLQMDVVQWHVKQWYTQALHCDFWRTLNYSC